MIALTLATETLSPSPAGPATALPRGHYELRGCLGEGGFGRVFEAWDPTLCRRVAIKCIKHGDAGGTALLREARLGASLRHAAFVKIHAIEDNALGQSIIMELVPGQTLGQRIAAGPVAQSTALAWMLQVADAMHDAHASGMVHGDLKPSNLMLEPGGAVRILDFGLACQLDTLATHPQAPTGLQGTIAYMAPERIRGAPPSEKTDIYAVGLILHEIVRSAQRHADHAPSDALLALVREMTAREAGQRLASMAEVRARLLQLSAPPAGDQPRGDSASRPRKTLARVLGAAVMGAAVMGAGGWTAAPYLAQLAPSLAPFSEAVEMERGLTALMLFDRRGSLDSAERHFRTILSRHPDSAAAHAGLSLMYSQRYLSDRRDESWLRLADASARRASERDDHLALGHIARGWVLDNQGKRSDALRAHADGLRLDPVSFFGWYGQVTTLRRMGRHDEARDRLAEAMRHFPRERVFTDELGAIEYEQANYAAAERLFRRSIALQPDAVFAYANLNAALMRQNRADEALQALQQGLQVRPSAKLYTNLGTSLFLREEYAGAVSAFEHAVSPTHGAPGDYQNWANLADTLNWIPARRHEALAAYHKARALLAPRLARAPDDVLMVSRMALYAARTGDAAYAAGLLPHALALAPASADVHFRAALTHELLGQRDAALVVIHQALRLGYPARFIDAEPDLAALRSDERYRPG